MTFRSDSQRKSVMAKLSRGVSRHGGRILALGAGIGAAELTRRWAKRTLSPANLDGLDRANRDYLKPRVGKNAFAKIIQASGVAPGLVIRRGKHATAADLGKQRRWNGAARVDAAYPHQRGINHLIERPPGMTSETLAHELGHLRKRNLQGLESWLHQRPTLARTIHPTVNLIEESLATMRGAKLYKRAGGRRRDYYRQVLPMQRTYWANYHNGIPAIAGAGALGYGAARLLARGARRLR